MPLLSRMQLLQVTLRVQPRRLQHPLVSVMLHKSKRLPIPLKLQMLRQKLLRLEMLRALYSMPVQSLAME